MELLIIIFLLLISRAFSNEEEKTKADVSRKLMMIVKYPFSTYSQERYDKLINRAVNGHKPEMLEFPDETALAEKLIALNNDRNASTDEKERLREQLLQAMMHNRGSAYIPKGMNIGNIYREYTEYAMTDFNSLAACNEYLRIHKPGIPKRPDIWESEKEWLREYQRSEEVVRRWNERAEEIGYIGGYEYNPEDKKWMREEAVAAKIERRQARRKARAEKREQRKENRRSRLF